MERQEKTKYILKQMLLLLRRSDYIRCQIVSKKLSPKLLEASDLQPLKVKFYELMTLYYLHEDALLDVAKCFGHIYNTQIVQDDLKQMKEVMAACAQRSSLLREPCNGPVNACAHATFRTGASTTLI